MIFEIGNNSLLICLNANPILMIYNRRHHQPLNMVLKTVSYAPPKTTQMKWQLNGNTETQKI